MKIYYAHPINLYGTPQEKRDVKLLVEMGFEVINPSYVAYQSEYQMRKENNDPNPFRFFKELAVETGNAAFRAFPDGTIGAGVYGEIMAVKQAGGLVIELPSMLECRGLSVDQTRAYLKELGAR